VLHDLALKNAVLVFQFLQLIERLLNVDLLLFLRNIDVARYVEVPLVLADIIQSHGLAVFLLRSETLIREYDSPDVLLPKLILLFSFLIIACPIKEKDLAASFLGLAPVQDEKAGGYPRAVKQFRRKADDGFYEVFLEDCLAYLSFRPSPEKDAVGKHDAGPPARIHDRDHVLNESEIRVSLRWNAVAEALERIALRSFVSPVLQREGRVRDHDVELHETPVSDELRIAQRVASPDLVIRESMEKEIHLADRPRADIDLLPEEGDIAGVLSPFLQMHDGLDEHASGAARGIADPLSRSRIQKIDEELDHFLRRIELPPPSFPRSTRIAR
jgi:hypothetical protein